MGSMDNYLRILQEAVEGKDRVTQPPIRPNRTLLEFYAPGDQLTIGEAMTVQATGEAWPAKWGATVAGPGGGSWKWNLVGKWG